MFNFIKDKGKNQNIYSPIDGKCMDISKCKDETFSQKMLGDGFVIEALNDVVCSPCNGKLTSIFPTKHAFGIEMQNGQNVLVHIGIDTVELQGECFTELAEVGSVLQAGTPVIRYDRKAIAQKGYDTGVVVIVVDKDNVVKQHLEENVKVKDLIIEGLE